MIDTQRQTESRPRANSFKPTPPNKMMSISADRYNIMYDFVDDILPDWEPEEVAEPLAPQRPPTPDAATAAANTIYDGMAGIFIAETAEELALEFSALANYILDNSATCLPFLTANRMIVAALLAICTQVRDQWPAAYALTFQLDAQLSVI